jgi:hypothetical protein
LGASGVRCAIDALEPKRLSKVDHCAGRFVASLGLTLKEIQGLAAVYLEQPGEPVRPHLAALLDEAERRVQGRIEELRVLQERIARRVRELVRGLLEASSGWAR